MYREHPIKILRYSVKNIWLLIFPLLRGARAFTFDVNALYRWVQGVWIDILVLLAIIAFGFFQWYFSSVTVESGGIIHSRGILIKMNQRIPFDKISSVTSEHPVYLRPFKAVKLSVDTSAGIFKNSDMKIMLRSDSWRKIFSQFPKDKKPPQKSKSHKPSGFSIIMFSAFFSSGFTGAVYIAAFFFKGGDIAKDIISVYLEIITQESSKLTGFLITKIPSAAVVMGALFLGAWLISFTVNLMRYGRFHLKSGERVMEIVCGILIRKRSVINHGHINYIDLKQDFFMKISGVTTVGISCAGYGNKKGQLPILTPLRKMKDAGIPRNHSKYRPKPTSIWQYIWQPVIGGAATAFVWYAFFELFPLFTRPQIFFLVIAELPFLWLLIIRTAAIFTSGVSVEEGKIILKYAKGYMFHTIVASRERLVKINVRQTPFQWLFKKCSVSFYFNGEGNIRHIVKALKLEDAQKITDNLD